MQPIYEDDDNSYMRKARRLAATFGGPTCATEIDDFCRNLSNLPPGFLDKFAVVGDAMVPMGVVHVRAFDNSNGEEFCGCDSIRGDRLTARHVVDVIAMDPRVWDRRWALTIAAPIVEVGFLDLMIDIQDV